MPLPFLTRDALRRDFEQLGISTGDIVMAHAAVSKVGRLLNGPDAVIGALLDAVGPSGTIMAYTDWDACYHELLDGEGRMPEDLKSHIPPFDRLRSRSMRDNGVFPEFLRTTQGALRSVNPGASMVALGAKAEWLTTEHPLDYGYGPGSPLAKLVAADGKVVMIGAPLDTMTLLHHAEHLADIPDKRLVRYEVPSQTVAGIEWRMVEEFNTSDPVVEGLPDDYFATIVKAFLETGQGQQGLIGQATSVVVDAAAITAFAVAWLENRFA